MCKRTASPANESAPRSVRRPGSTRPRSDRAGTPTLRWALALGLGLASCDGTADPEAASGTAGGKADEPDANGDLADGGLDVNDVTFLFALDRGLPVPAMALDDARLGVGAAMLADIRAALAADAEYPFDPVPTTLSPTLSDWFVVAARYDPCATDGSAHDAASGLVDPDVDEQCVQLLRLVVQPFPDAEPAPDAALHVIYALGSGAPAIDDPNVGVLRRLKALAHTGGSKTDGAPLSVHPALSAELEAGEHAFADALAEGIAAIVSRGRLVNIAATSLMLGNATVVADGGAVWAFVSGEVEGDRWHSIPQPIEFTLLDETVERTKDFITCLRLGCGKDACVDGESGSDCGTIVPADPDRPSLHQIFFPATEDKRAEWAHEAHRIDDPLAFDIDDVACADCHMTRGTYARFGVPSTDDRRTPPPGITGYGSCDVTRGPTWNTRNLGYFDSHATASTRTVLETAFAADFINQRVLDADNPGLDCTDVDEAVWSCLVLAPSQPQGSCDAEHTTACLSQCKPKVDAP